MSEIIQIKCPTCGKIIGSEDICGTIIHCPGCHSYKVLSDNRSVLKPVFYKLYPHDDDSLFTKENFYESFVDQNNSEVFNVLKLTGPLRRYYLPMRQISKDGEILQIPLNKRETAEILSLMSVKSLYDPSDKKMFDEGAVRDLVTTDFNPIYSKKKDDQVTFLPIDVSFDEIDASQGVNKNEMTIIRYLPISLLPTNLGTVVATGTGKNFRVVNNSEISYALWEKTRSNETDWNEIKDKVKNGAEKVKNFFSFVIGFVVLAFIIYGVYTVFTTGITIEKVMNGIGIAFISAIGLGLLWFCLVFSYFFFIFLVVGLCLILGPAPLFLYTMLKRKKKSANKGLSNREKNKGKRIFGIP